MDATELDRRSHIRRWAVLMIAHLEGRENDPPRYTYEEALVRLRELLDLEIGRTLDEDVMAPAR